MSGALPAMTGAASYASGYVSNAPRSPGVSPRTPAGGARSSRPSPSNRGRLALVMTLALAVLLAGAGFGAVRAAELLQHAMHVLLTPTDLARATCTAYTTQTYALLTAQIDPTPIPPANSDAFNPAAVATQLRAVDKIQGTTQRCDIGQFSATGSTGQYSFTLHRTHVQSAIALVLILREQSDGSWKISRETNFTGAPAA